MKYRSSYIFLSPHTPQAGALLQTPATAVASSAYWLHKPVYKIKYKSNNNFSEQKFSKRFTMSNTNKVNKVACQTWAESDDNFAIKIFFKI